MKRFPRNQTLFNKLNQSLRSITSWKIQNSNLRAENESLKKTNRKLNGKAATEPPEEWEETLAELKKTIKLKEKEVEELKKEITKLRSFKDISERMAKRKESAHLKETKKRKIGDSENRNTETVKPVKKLGGGKTSGAKPSSGTGSAPCNVLKVREPNMMNMKVVAGARNAPGVDNQGGDVVSKSKKSSATTRQ